MKTILIGLAFAVCLLWTSGQKVQGQDSDGDGLSDFHEIHKHFTDPNKADSDGDGTNDGDWNERREYAYTIRSVVKVMPPISEDALTDDYQDGRVLGETDRYVEIEVIHYPLNKIANSIQPNPNWRSDVRGDDDLKKYLDPGPTTNWDTGMKNHMKTELRKGGVDVRRLDDCQLVRAVSEWMMRRAGSLNSGSYGIIFDEAGPKVLPDHEDGFRAVMFDPKGTIEEQFQRELYGKGMYYNEICGSCTSAANYLTTGLKAMGVPTRMVRAIPVVDASNPEQIRLVEEGITNKDVAETILPGVRALGKSFAAHTYNEVYVGGRWHRLNYSRLGQNIMDEQFMGLMTHIHRYGDLAEAGIGETWGRWLNEPKAEPFMHSNPYHTVHLSDQMPVHNE